MLLDHVAKEGRSHARGQGTLLGKEDTILAAKAISLGRCRQAKSHFVQAGAYPHPYPTPPLQDVRSVETGNLSCFICQDISPVSRAEVGI